MFRDYANLEHQKRLIEDKQQELRRILITEMEKEDVERVESDWGTFSFAKSRIWTFSPTVDKLNDDLVKLKAEEKAKGTASFKEEKILKFYPKQTNE